MLITVHQPGLRASFPRQRSIAEIRFGVCFGTRLCESAEATLGAQGEAWLCSSCVASTGILPLAGQSSSSKRFKPLGESVFVLAGGTYFAQSNEDVDSKVPSLKMHAQHCRLRGYRHHGLECNPKTKHPWMSVHIVWHLLNPAIVRIRDRVQG